MLEQIKHPNDIKNINPKDYRLLAKEIRKFLLLNVSRTGGHLASNLGAVELTMALHLTMDFPKDQLVFDVGHQSYVHKILTGRMDGFKSLRQYGGMSGFPKRTESDCDAFHSGHSSTSIGVALGLSQARDLRGTDETIVAVLGDGALSGGMAYEALNNMVRLREEKRKLIVVLNDNKMSISENVGGMSGYLNRVRSKKEYVDFKGNIEKSLMQIPVVGEPIAKGLKRSKDSIKQLFVPGMMFEDMGITYIGPIDGHNVPLLAETFQRAQKLEEPIIVHVVTKKGKGYKYAEQDPSRFHGVNPFNVRTGKALKSGSGPTCTDIFSDTVVELAKDDPDIVAVTAAMPEGTGLSKFRDRYPERFFDVGIAEQHAVAFCAGMAAKGLKPVAAVYSTFLQRAYDQLLHDVGIGNLPVLIGVDRSGLVGADGETHQGIFDVTYLSSIPNFTVTAPVNGRELKEMVTYALTEEEGPVAVKYSRGPASDLFEEDFSPVKKGKGCILKKGTEIALIPLGSMMEEGYEVYKELVKLGYEPTLVNPRFVKPLDTDLICSLMEGHRLIVTMEEGVLNGGFGQQVTQTLTEHDYKGRIRNIGIDDQFVEHGSVDELRKMLGLDSASMTDKIKEWIGDKA
ncbi:1-deoxy-D-xylulose-5-phosphate synthase [Anaerostipes sp.]|uniref:1-deoxy-D-xylulose-5-phosphate synthase n=1 Tax=Anaerostipes sp. TaxID=1872530 RepID=UPI0025BDA1C2|nr:1-deoxy-D-xylulose-5-phosphate synthase [Anaerostipes sp.]MBS7008013.1 1-deoxy-D-xylulose-5-phosphate synthase [Anaerostipes sp.]